MKEEGQEEGSAGADDQDDAGQQGSELHIHSRIIGSMGIPGPPDTENGQTCETKGKKEFSLPIRLEEEEIEDANDHKKDIDSENKRRYIDNISWDKIRAAAVKDIVEHLSSSPYKTGMTPDPDPYEVILGEKLWIKICKDHTPLGAIRYEVRVMDIGHQAANAARQSNVATGRRLGRCAAFTVSENSD
jgi:hypothetical protein